MKDKRVVPPIEEGVVLTKYDNLAPSAYRYKPMSRSYSPREKKGKQKGKRKVTLNPEVMIRRV